MTVRILRDVEESISREIRRITFFEDRSVAPHTVLKDTFDPLTGELVQLPIEPDFYDSSADTKNIQYPHFFVKLLRMREDRTTGRVIPQYGKTSTCAIETSPKAYEIVLYQSDGQISAPGENLTTSAFQIKKAQVGFFLRILNGNNIGTYIIDSVVPSNTGIHTITVSDSLLEDLPNLIFNSVTRIINFETPVDLNTIKVNDIFTDNSNNTFNIISIDLDRNSIEIDGSTSPDLVEGSKITRTSPVFQNSDSGLLTYMVMDPSKPILNTSGSESYSGNMVFDPSVPLDLFYLVRIDSKERDTHIDVANRMWEEFNPPRTGLPTIVRTASSAEQLLTQDISTGGSNTAIVADNSNYNVNDTVFIFNDLTPTKAVDGRGFQEVFTATITQLVGSTQIILNKTIPDTFKADDNTKIVSNALYLIYMFHLEDHVTRDVEGAQYWVHEFTFWIQIWIDRQGEPVTFDGVVQSIGIDGNGFLDGPTILDCN